MGKNKRPVFYGKSFDGQLRKVEAESWGEAVARLKIAFGHDKFVCTELSTVESARDRQARHRICRDWGIPQFS